ncbi:MAG: di-trans,poly-cis-decaprenylcistransferase [Papillibacter sp.]|jgi:undecaprenyl diphosphate synthase|nr:di-trans,poly-cis-decaprenylcistransferase [Papillibacter sp.]
MSLFGKNKKRVGEERSKLNIPTHLAIIMDGNGRWAKKRGLPRSAGHSAGAETFRKIVRYCRDIGIKYLTVYMFSTENWKRDAEEIANLMVLLEKYLHEAIQTMEEEGASLYIMGDLSRLSPGLRRLADEALEVAKRVKGIQVNVCFNYGGRDEIVRAARRFAEDYKAGRVSELDEATFSNYMYSAGLPDPDLIIRPSGEKRTSNFLLWQSAYSEYHFTDTLWPDFTPRDIDKAIEDYSHRNRRFGA